jgi:hypothetical protein
MAAAWSLAALLVMILPGGGWNDGLALLASMTAVWAGHERRNRAMVVAAGLAAGLGPAGWLLMPLCTGLAIRRNALRHLPVALLVGAAAHVALPWPGAGTPLPNLAVVASALPDGLALIVGLGAGTAAWLGARGCTLSPPAMFAEARLGVALMAALLPLPLGILALVVALATLPLPAGRRRRAANDNAVVRRQPIRLAA